ncbi:lipocalin family protein [Rheinheimera sp. MM224]|uniref:lipocalin family protein n=1 Tax=Rheinheimera sp. MM224 TaxID=3019969 RepID=UPI0021F88483|nr:lipocalin family protein [Rheinheimera sp. MM224]
MVKSSSICLMFALTFSCFAAELPIAPILGTWTYVVKGADFKETKTCTFSQDGHFKCLIDDFGFSSSFGDGHRHQTKGLWSVSNNTLSITEIALDQKTELQYQISTVNKDTLILLSAENVNQVWRRIENKH